jgi:catechol 2,3-dioxygenase-like lactoylglutathione lyase family enzyme
MSIEINGMAHVILTVSDFPAARAFYGKLLSLMGMTAVCDTDKFFYCVGGRTAIGIEPCGPEHRHERFVQTRVGLHHLCLRARSRAESTPVPPRYGTWAPPSFAARSRAHGRPATIMFYSKTPTAYAWRSITFLAPGFLPTAQPSLPAKATGEVATSSEQRYSPASPWSQACPSGPSTRHRVRPLR